MRTIKEDLVYINEFGDKKDFVEAFEKWVDRYNNEYPHSALKYLVFHRKTPTYQAERLFVKNSYRLIKA